MGLTPSFLGKGAAMNYIMGSAMDQLYHKFVKKDIETFEQFHNEILDIFSTLNSALPGKHFEVLSRDDVKDLFTRWNAAEDERKKKDEFVEFMKTTLKLSKADHFTLIAGMVTPPAAMMAKKAGESVPQLRIIKSVPDVIFVPSATVLSLISAKIFQKMVKHDQHPRT